MALVLFVPVLVEHSKFTSLSAGIHMGFQAVGYNVLFYGCFFFVSASCHYLS